MNNDIALLVIGVCTDIGLDVRSYSGRGMYGAQCVGVDTGSPFQDFAKIVVGLTEIGGPEGLEAAEHFTRDGAVATDSMGRGSILYFPRLPWVEACECGDHGCEKTACQDREPDSGDIESAPASL